MVDQSAAIAQLQADVAQLMAAMAAQTATNTAQAATLDLHAIAMNTFFLIWGGSMVFLMQAGFAMLEIGSCSIKCTKDLLIKNLLDMAVGSLAWFAVGQGFANSYNHSPFWSKIIGGGDFLSSGLTFSDAHGNYGPVEGYHYALWFYQWAFAGAATTICSGAVGERLTLSAYFLYAWFMCAIIYTLVSRWAWNAQVIQHTILTICCSFSAPIF